MEPSVLNTIVDFIVLYGTPLAAVVAAATAITMATPSKVDDKILGGFGSVLNIVLKLANTMAGNVLKNKNKDNIK